MGLLGLVALSKGVAMNTIAMMKRLEQEGVTFWFDKPRKIWMAKLGNADVCEGKYLGNVIWDAAKRLGED